MRNSKGSNKKFKAKKGKYTHSFSWVLANSFSRPPAASLGKWAWPREAAAAERSRAPPTRLQISSPGDHVGGKAHEEGPYERADLLGGTLPPPLLFLQTAFPHTASERWDMVTPTQPGLVMLRDYW